MISKSDWFARDSEMNGTYTFKCSNKLIKE